MAAEFLLIHPGVLWTIVFPIIILNLFLMVTIKKSPKLQTAPNYFAFCASLSNFVTGVMLVLVLLLPIDSFYLVGALWTLTKLVSIAMCCAAAYDRFCATVWTDQYQLPERKAAILIGILCTLSLLIALMPLIWLNTLHKHKGYITLNCLILVVSTLIQIVVYAFAFKKAKFSMQQMAVKRRESESGLLNERQNQNLGNLDQLKGHLHIAKLFIVLTLVYFLFWLPDCYVTIMDDVIVNHSLSPDWLRMIASHFKLLPCLIQPCMVLMFQTNMRQTIRSYFNLNSKRKFRSFTFDEEEHSANSLDTTVSNMYLL